MGVSANITVRLKEIRVFLVYLLKRFEKNENRKSASALTFMTLFAMVPLMTVGYCVLRMFPQFSQVTENFYDFVFKHFIPTSGSTIQEYLQGFSQQASELTAIGSVLLLVSAVSLMLMIEEALNKVWRVKQSRSGKVRFLIYWAVLSLGPILMGMAILLSSYLLSLPFVSDVDSLLGGVISIIKLLPFLLSVMALTLVYKVVPGCYVDLRYALAGALVAGVIIEVGKNLFVLVVKSFPSYQFIYGAFSIVPLFLLWVNIAWCIVLLGAEFVRALTFARKHRKGIVASDLDWALELLRIIQAGQLEKNFVSRNDIAGLLPMANADDWEAILAILVDEGWIVETKKEAYMTGPMVTNASLYELGEVIAANHFTSTGIQWKNSQWYEKLNPLFKDLQDQQKAALALPVCDLINELNEKPVSSYKT